MKSVIRTCPKSSRRLRNIGRMSGGPQWQYGLLVLGAIVAAFMIVSRRPTTSLTAIPENSIAVLPFVDMSAGKDQEYFSDGISEELLNLLGGAGRPQAHRRHALV